MISIDIVATVLIQTCMDTGVIRQTFIACIYINDRLGALDNFAHCRICLIASNAFTQSPIIAVTIIQLCRLLACA